MLSGHAVGWPVRARRLAGGRRRARLVSARRSAARSSPATASSAIDELADAGAVLLDLTPRQIARDRRPPAARPLPPRARALPLRAGRLQARLGARRPDPVDARRSAARAGTVHLGGTFEEIAAVGARRGDGGHPSGPTCCSPSRRVFDPSRAPGGQAHRLGLLPRAGRLDRGHDRARSRRQVERFAPGFRERILARASMNAAEMEALQPQLRRRRHQRRRCRTCASSSPARCARPVPYTTPDRAALHLLVVDPARRRRPRHVRLLRRQGGAQARMSEATSPRSSPTIPGRAPTGPSTIPGRCARTRPARPPRARPRSPTRGRRRA